jgi:formate hydrogenlyase subunit 3/multisubunit Na+/H+ antiporter MnhD subunit
MNGALLTLAWLTPLVAAAAATRLGGGWLAPAAAIPALTAALLVPTGAVADIPWLLLGVRLGLDDTARIFLLFTAILWLIAGLQALSGLPNAPRSGRFRVFFLLAMAGNFGLIVGQDLASFFLGFALMGLAAYGLVVHEDNEKVRFAGRVYLAMTLAAEMALFSAFVLIAGDTGTLVPTPAQLADMGDAAVGLLVLALGIKAGLLGLHVWLPLAHPAAPIPASAVLSGTMIKAALIGWMRYLPLGEVALPGWGTVLMVAGGCTVLFALPMGLLQTHPKVLLAYSSVGKMGLMTAMLGLALLEPVLASPLLMALAFYAGHHGLAKGALFLGVDVVNKSSTAWALAAIAVPALALVGAPFTSGAMVKGMLDPLLSAPGGAWHGVVGALLLASTLGTTLLMGRFLILMGGLSGGAPGTGLAPAVPWLALLALILAVPMFSDQGFPSPIAAWPALAAAAVTAVVAAWRPRPLTRLAGRVPPGDILGPVLARAQAISRAAVSAGAAVSRPLSWRPSRTGNRWIERARQRTQCVEQALRAWPVAGAGWLAVAAATILLLLAV